MSIPARLMLLLLLCCSLPLQAAGPSPVLLRPGLHVGGQPSPAQLRELAAQGTTTVIDLRTGEEDRGFDEAAEAASLGLHYLRIPVAGADGLTGDNLDAVQHALQHSKGPVLLHCASGNRVGAVMALLEARRKGADANQALQLGRAAGLGSLEPAVRARLGQTAETE